MSNFLKNVRVGRYENRFIFFWKAIQIAGLAQKQKQNNRDGRVSGNTGIFRPYNNKITSRTTDVVPFTYGNKGNSSHYIS